MSTARTHSDPLEPQGSQLLVVVRSDDLSGLAPSGALPNLITAL